MKKKKPKLPRYVYDVELGRIELPQPDMSKVKKQDLRRKLKDKIKFATGKKTA